MAMIRLLSVGSRGDLQPYLAILLELQRRGHSVQLIGSINFEAIATEHAVPFVPLPGDYRQLLRSKQGLKMMRGRPVQLVSKQLLEAMLTTADAAMAGTDLLLVTPLALWGYHYFSLLKWRQDSRVIQAWRRERGLAPLPWGGARSRRDAPAQLANPTVLHLFSPQVLARPADWQESFPARRYRPRCMSWRNAPTVGYFRS
jgi:hypothetical protein